MMNKVYVLNVTTPSCDHYTYVFGIKPSEKKLQKFLKNKFEDSEELDELDYHIEECEVMK